MTSVAIEGEALRQLVADAQQGDRAAADRLVRAHEGWVRSAIYAVMGRSDHLDDVAQQVWTRALDGLPSLENPRRLRAWLYTVARNTAIDYGQMQRRRRELALDGQLDDMPARSAGVANPPAALAADELRGTLVRAVQALPVLYREPFVLRHLENWSYAEIAEVLGVPVENVETRLVRARRLLREMLQKDVQS